MALSMAQHYVQHQELGTPSTKDGLPFRVVQLTTTQRDDLTNAGLVENGDFIYNTTDNKFQGYANSSWVDFH